jgi:hypothetical protein
MITGRPHDANPSRLRASPTHPGGYSHLIDAKGERSRVGPPTHEETMSIPRHPDYPQSDWTALEATKP